jgi:hypothetical protein
LFLEFARHQCGAGDLTHHALHIRAAGAIARAALNASSREIRGLPSESTRGAQSPAVY